VILYDVIGRGDSERQLFQKLIHIPRGIARNWLFSPVVIDALDSTGELTASSQVRPE
jgi:hypothetical protein